MISRSRLALVLFLVALASYARDTPASPQALDPRLPRQAAPPVPRQAGQRQVEQIAILLSRVHALPRFQGRAFVPHEAGPFVVLAEAHDDPHAIAHGRSQLARRLGLLCLLYDSLVSEYVHHGARTFVQKDLLPILAPTEGPPRIIERGQSPRNLPPDTVPVYDLTEGWLEMPLRLWTYADTDVEWGWWRNEARDVSEQGARFLVDRCLWQSSGNPTGRIADGHWLAMGLVELLASARPTGNPNGPVNGYELGGRDEATRLVLRRARDPRALRRSVLETNPVARGLPGLPPPLLFGLRELALCQNTGALTIGSVLEAIVPPSPWREHLDIEMRLIIRAEGRVFIDFCREHAGGRYQAGLRRLVTAEFLGVGDASVPAALPMQLAGQRATARFSACFEETEMETLAREFQEFLVKW